MFIGSFLTYLGMLLFSFSLEKHHKQVIKRSTNRQIKILAKILGTLFLALALFVLIKHIGLSLGITYWVGLLGIAAVFIAFLYTYKPQLIIKISIILFIVALILNFI